MNPPIFEIARKDPIEAVRTKFIFPRFPATGPKIFPYLFALFELSKSFSFKTSNFSFASSSYENTLTTFSPSSISSIYPFTAPIFSC